jgi:hypothetical protein
MPVTRAEFVNLLIAKIHPWHPVEFILFNSDQIVLKIGHTFCTAESDFEINEWVISTLRPDKNEFVERLNLILRGWTRNDEGVLQDLR